MTEDADHETSLSTIEPSRFKDFFDGTNVIYEGFKAILEVNLLCQTLAVC